MHEEQTQAEKQQTFRMNQIEKTTSTSHSTVVLETDEDSTSTDMNDGGQAIPMESTRTDKGKGPFTRKEEQENCTKTSGLVTARSIFGM